MTDPFDGLRIGSFTWCYLTHAEKSMRVAEAVRLANRAFRSQEAYDSTRYPRWVVEALPSHERGKLRLTDRVIHSMDRIIFTMSEKLSYQEARHLWLVAGGWPPEWMGMSNSEIDRRVEDAITAIMPNLRRSAQERQE